MENEELKTLILESINSKLRELDKVNLRIAELEEEMAKADKNPTINILRGVI